MTSLDQILLELQTGARMILQRLPLTLTDAEIHEKLSNAERPVDVIHDITAPSPLDRVRLLTARGWLPERFAGWDRRRHALCSPERPVVVVLDVVAAASVLQAAPQCCSWAGGVRLPLEPIIQLARTDEQIAVGARVYRNLYSENPDRLPAGERVAIDIGTGRVFRRRRDAQPERVAAESLDGGLVYLCAWGEP